MKLSNKNLSILGASLYICEGTRMRIDNRGWRQYVIEFTNKEPQVIRLFLKFLREIISADKSRIKAQLFVYPDHSESELKAYWISQTQIPASNFNQTIFLKQKNIKYKPNPLGVIKIRYHHKEHFLKLQSIINNVFEIEKPRRSRIAVHSARLEIA